MRVADTGIGIKAEDQARIFDKFERGDSASVREQEGTGLGLALTRKLAELHGGSVGVESEGIKGRGSLFTVLLPLASPEPSVS
jgi:two-component system sensor histidine kinase BaeS